MRLSASGNTLCFSETIKAANAVYIAIQNDKANRSITIPFFKILITRNLGNVW